MPCHKDQEFRVIAHDVGYACVEILEKEIKSFFKIFPYYDQMLQHFAFSNHAVDFEIFLQQLGGVISAYDISFVQRNTCTGLLK